MSLNKIAEIEALLASTSPGEWTFAKVSGGYQINDPYGAVIIDIYSFRGNAENDARFIVTARQSITDLIQVTREIARQVLDAEAKAERAFDCHGASCGACVSCLNLLLDIRDREIRMLRLEVDELTARKKTEEEK